MSRDLALLDTNVLIDALYRNSDHYAAVRALLEQAMQLASASPVSARRYPRHVANRTIFDAQLVATMLAHSVRTIDTFNVSDFSPFAKIEVIEPKAP